MRLALTQKVPAAVEFDLELSKLHRPSIVGVALDLHAHQAVVEHSAGRDGWISRWAPIAPSET